MRTDPPDEALQGRNLPQGRSRKAIRTGGRKAGPAPQENIMTKQEYKKQLLQQHSEIELLPDPAQQGILDNENIEMLVKAYKSSANIPPIVAQCLWNGDLQILEGHHRYEAAKIAGVKPDVIVKTAGWVRKQRKAGDGHLEIEYDAQARFEKYAELMYQRKIRERRV